MTEYDAKTNKKLFYEKMQPYFDEGMVREIYSSVDGCVLSFGEITYIACSYILIDDNPLGIYVDSEAIFKIVQDRPYMLGLINHIFQDPYKYRSLIYNLSPDKINAWKEWIAKEKTRGIIDIDPELEAEINRMSNNTVLHSQSGSTDKIKSDPKECYDSTQRSNPMKTYESIGNLVGAIVGTVLCGVAVYLTKSVFCAVIPALCFYFGGSIGKSIAKPEE